MKSDAPASKELLRKRLRQLRKSHGLTQAAAALYFDTTRESWSSYEEGRAQMPWGVYLKIFHKFQVSAFWLAGESNFQLAPMAENPAAINVSSRLPFLTAFALAREALKPSEDKAVQLASERLRSAGEEYLECLELFAGLPENRRVDLLREGWLALQFAAIQQTLNAWLEIISPAYTREQIRDGLLALWKRRSTPQKLSEPSAPGKVSGTSYLQASGISTISEPVLSRIPTNWDDLLNDLKAATTERGSKVRLARQLKVNRQRISEWLSGKGKPDAELTIALLRILRTGISKK
jgi:transcriptional regulator with XRE-family HTH domain